MPVTGCLYAESWLNFAAFSDTSNSEIVQEAPKRWFFQDLGFEFFCLFVPPML